ncbi:hypothetical protein [Xanthomonas campestris]|uniref:hypothetical protein n=1 Tax=Xanthomonas campestris TaxID=339 RepID=UPI001D14285C|nr:hypothetical protein [Xanthomonas campestris]MCC3256529.1 hypothetical protein [Xanthomonas campestris pv. armoraciae]MCF8798344.1 hypothetical protein [Xanthomonas campestris pv. campestris]MCF8816032.1 hypothetical protein [Xanthomonas campestris pv. campestris]WHO88751.1 hypothetical protein QMY63_00180 [Xanthomonas campestris]
MSPQPVKPQVPFVYIVDSPSPNDLLEGYSIGMALRDSLRAIKIPTFYALASNQQMLSASLQGMLHSKVGEVQSNGQVDAYPFIHLCMHGNQFGLQLTDQSMVAWPQLRGLLYAHNQIKGYDPILCMASCEGLGASSMANAYDSAFNFLIGNTGLVFQSDLTVAYLAFYNSIFYKRQSIEQSVLAMKAACGDHNFYFAAGQQIKQQRFSEAWSQHFPSNPSEISI